MKKKIDVHVLLNEKIFHFVLSCTLFQRILKKKNISNRVDKVQDLMQFEKKFKARCGCSKFNTL
jgi:hypothetical protein